MANGVADDGASKLWFQYDHGRRKWAAFPWGANASIRGAFRGGKAKVKVTVNDTPFDIRVGKMMQVNLKTKYERSIRCLVGDDNCYYVWQWQDSKRRWNLYPCDATLKLEAAFAGDKKGVSLTLDGRSCTVDVAKMEQSDAAGNTAEKVKRLQVDFTPPPKEDTPPPSPPAAEEVLADTAKPKAGAKSGRKRVMAGAGDQGKPAKTPKSEIKTVRLTGHAAPVDIECAQMQGKAHVFQEGQDVYDAMLNQTNLANNNNKYYLLQLLEGNAKKDFYVWFRWGRVGLKGQNNLIPCGTNLDKAKETFMNKFWDKTRNEWSGRRNFSKVQGKYDLLKMDYTAETKDKDEPDGDKKEEKPKPASKLDKRVQDLITLICNIQAMEDMVVEMKYDAQKAPLGKLTSDQIKAGYVALKKVEKCHEKKDFGRALVQACDEFYTRIPHNFGMQRPPIIRSRDDLKAKIALLEALGDIQVAMTVLKAETNVNEHPIDRQYHALKCHLKPVEKTHPDFKMVGTYLKNTHAMTHNQYSMELLDLFELDKEGEETAFRDLGNRKLLWHGSRLTNWAGILGQGLRIAPPEAPVTGYMFGKGVYFADMSSKSCNYCFATPSKNVGVAVLSEVALGSTNDLLAADYYADKLPAGKDSVWGQGKIAPDKSADFTMPDGTVVPLGKGKPTGVTNPDGYTLNYNEFVVYNTNQIRMRYLVKIRFNFK